MKKTTATTAARELAALLDAVEKGQMILITRHARPVAVISSAAWIRAGSAEAAAKLEPWP